jgi:CRP-like cAMP-binding protein
MSLNPAELFRQDSHALKIGPGDFLFREGETGDKMYVLLEGNLDILFGDLVLETAGPGALIGEMALIDNGPRAATAVAKTPCRLAQIDRRRFHFLVQQTPHFATHVMKSLADRLRRMNAIAAVRSAQESV